MLEFRQAPQPINTAPLWVIVMILLAFSGFSYAQGTLIWAVIGAIAALTAAIVAGFALKMQMESRNERLRREGQERDLRQRPFEDMRLWVQSVQEGQLGLDVPRTPDLYEGETLDIVVGEYWIMIRAKARTGWNINEANLRFIDSSIGRPTVTSFTDPDHRGPHALSRSDQSGGYDFSYSPPKPDSENKVINYIGRFYASFGWEGDLSLLLDLVPGFSAALRIPVQVIEQSPPEEQSTTGSNEP